MTRVAVIAILCAGCRIQPAEHYWIEAHGRASLKDIAASPRGVEGIGQDGDVLYYGGDVRRPWRSVHRGRAKQVGASPRSTYVLGQDGVISVVTNGRIEKRQGSERFAATFVAAGEDDTLYVVSAGRAHRVDGTELVPLPCSEPARSIAVASSGVYVASTEGALALATGEECRSVEVPGPVSSLGAFAGRLAVVVKGWAYERIEGRWQKLPAPRRYRETGIEDADVSEVAVSRNTLWARSSSGHVFALWEPR